MVWTFLRRIRGDPRYKNSFFVYLFEANLNQIDTHRWRTELLRDKSLEPHWFYDLDQEATRGGCGVWTTMQTKHNGIHTLKSHLKQCTVSFATNLITHYVPPKEVASTQQRPEDAIKTLLSWELNCVRRRINISKTLTYQGDSFTYSGKGNGRDDAVMVTVIALYFAYKLKHSAVFHDLLRRLPRDPMNPGLALDFCP